ncbi:MAG: chromate transporter [Alphaproteobacteria bacterium]
MNDEEKPPIPLFALLVSFFRVGMTAFGGGTASWTYRELADRRGWIDHQVFVTGLTFSQVMPGANPVNLALYLGMQLRGGLGGFIAVVGLVTPAFCLIILIGLLYNWLSAYPATSVLLGGVAAVGVGATLSVGAKLAQVMVKKAEWTARIMQGLIAVATFAAIGIMRWPTIPVVAVAVPASVLIALAMERSRRDG